MTLRIGSFPAFVTIIVRYPGHLPDLRKDMAGTVYGVCAGSGAAELHPYLEGLTH